MTRNQINILDSIKAKLHDVLPKDGYAILYGSQARGDFHQGSDWDILIVVDKDRVSISENSDITYPLVMLGWDMNVEINPVLYTKNEWETYKDTPFHDNVIHDGIRIAG